MKTITVASNATGVTTVENSSVISAAVDGFTAPFTLGANEYIDVSGARWVAIDYGVLGLVLGGLITRKRIQADPGSQPMLGFLF